MIAHLTERLTALYIRGLKTTGDLIEAVEYIGEDLTPDEYKTLSAFAKWADTHIGGCSENNIHSLFRAWRFPHDVTAQQDAKRIAKAIRNVNKYKNKPEKISQDRFSKSRERFTSSDLYKDIFGYCNWEREMSNFKLECWNIDIDGEHSQVIIQIYPDGKGFNWYLLQ